MTPSSHSSNPVSESAMAAEHDLLASILTSEPVYPWQPLAPEADEYLAHLEAEFDALDDGELSGAIASGWQTLTTQMAAQLGEQASIPRVSTGAIAAVVDHLGQFQGRLPGGLLQSLATTATGMVRSGQPLIEQLVQCVNVALPGWNANDLAVLARPLAYSLRDGRSEILELNLRAIPPSPWETLSDLEQARLALAIASVALKSAQANCDTVDG